MPALPHLPERRTSFLIRTPKDGRRRLPRILLPPCPDDSLGERPLRLDGYLGHQPFSEAAGSLASPA